MTLGLAAIGLGSGDKSVLLHTLESYGVSARLVYGKSDILLCAGRSDKRLPECKVAVTFGCDSDTLGRLRDMGCTVITCGTAPTDTLSISHIGESSSAVSLQRSLVSLGGRRFEPCEIPVRLCRKADSDIVSAVAAVLLLCGVGADKGFLLAGE